jgi:hypothetical protein
MHCALLEAGCYINIYIYGVAALGGHVRDPGLEIRCEGWTVNIYIYIYIHLWPVGLEGDGTPYPQFELLINNVCGAAVNIKGLICSSFKTYFQSRIANTLAQ